jgi:DNA-binding NtrC family response regulator
MTGVPLQLLLIEDSPDDVELLRIELDNGGYRPSLQVVTDAAGLRAALTGRAWDVVVSDHNLPTFDSSSALAIVREHDRNLPFIIVSGCLGEEAAVEAMKAGADDYVMKGRFGRLLPAIQRGLREARLRRERREALREIEESGARLQILTGSPAWSSNWRAAATAALASPT